MPRFAKLMHIVLSALLFGWWMAPQPAVAYAETSSAIAPARLCNTALGDRVAAVITSTLPTTADAPVKDVTDGPAGISIGAFGPCTYTTISSALGAASPNYPSTTGAQTNRPFRGGTASTCGTLKTPGTPISGTFTYNAYEFKNSSPLTECVTVQVDTACTGTNFIFPVAYMGSYNPSDLTQNYLADSGSSPNPQSIFSFEVPAGATFILVISEVTAGAGCSNYDITLSGQPYPARITSALGGVTGDYPALTGLQTSRLFRDGTPSICGVGDPSPGTLGAASHTYNAYSFENTDSQSRCVTIEIVTDCTGGNFLFVAAYLGAFDPANIETNYLGDIGSSPGPTGSFSVDVPAGGTVVIVVSEVTAGAGCGEYTVNIDGLPCILQVVYLPIVTR